jgi:glutamate--cysteine ligase catalytic subunit
VLQVEYLVVVWTDDDKRVLVSLRQADILKALANDAELTSGGGGVPDIKDTTGARCVFMSSTSSSSSRSEPDS